MPRGIGYGKKRRTLGPQGVRPVVGAGTMQPLYGKRRNYFDPMQDMGADFRVRPPGGSPQYQTQQAAQAVQSRLGQPDPMIQRQQMRELGRQSIPAPLTPRMDAVNQLGAQNMAGIQGDPRMLQYGIAQAPNLGEMPAADAYRQMQASDPAGPYSGMSGGYSQQRLLNTGNQLGLARTPNVPGEGAGESIAYRPGASGSSPFVSDGPLSGGPRGAELQQRLDAINRNREGTRTVNRTLYERTPDGGVRLVGPQAGMSGLSSDQMVEERRNLIGGVPTTRDPETGEVIAKHAYQQPQLDVRRRRLGEVQDFREQRRAGGRLGQPQGPQQQGQLGIGQQAPAIADPTRRGFVERSIQPEFPDPEDPERTISIPPSEMTYDQALTASDQIASNMVQLVSAGHVNPEEARGVLADVSRQYPQGANPLSAYMLLLQAAQQEQERQQQQREELESSGKGLYTLPSGEPIIGQ